MRNNLPRQRLPHLPHQLGILRLLPRNTQGQILRIHHPLDESTPLGQNIRRFGFDQDFPTIQRYSRLHSAHAVLFLMKAGYVEQGLDVQGGIHSEVEGVEGFVVHVGDILVKGRVGILRHGLGIVQPNGVEGVDSVSVEVDGIPHEVGISFEDLFDGGFVGVVAAFGAEMEDYGRAAVLADGVGEGGDGVRSRAGGRPDERRGVGRRRVGGGFGTHVDPVGHHEPGIKAHPEFADDALSDGGVCPSSSASQLRLHVHLLDEGLGARSGNGPQIAHHVVSRHADAGIRNGQRVGRLVGRDADFEGDGRVIAAVAADFSGGLEMAQFFEGVGGVGDEFAEEDFLVGVERVGHDVEELARFGLEFDFVALWGLFRRRAGTGRERSREIILWLLASLVLVRGRVDVITR
mmetsp:Transcript_13844/g.28219  ORF Transcript_13844/g.28219 Transcript_13844/m.28219 type:complete len:405 (-) Transcript_13844:193-1407(-)